MWRNIAAFVYVLTLLVACSKDPSPDAPVEPSGKGGDPIQIANVPEHEADPRSYETDAPINYLRDAPIYGGWISRTGEAFEFRACDQGESYYVDMSFSIRDTIDQVFQSQPAANRTRIYVRFHGEVFSGVDSLPDRYPDTVRITQLISYDASVPVVCR